jgi:long-chain acyl-CoA synthetase
VDDTVSPTLLEALSMHARDQGQRLAVECAGRALDYASLEIESNRVAAGLVKLGLAPGARVAFWARSCVEYFELLIGAMKAALVVVPVNWRLADPEVDAVIQDCAAEVLVVGDEYVQRLPALTGSRARLRHVVTLTDAADLDSWRTLKDDAPVAAVDREPPSASTVVLQIYTSGTTGRPKGVMNSAQGMAFYLRSLSQAAAMTTESISLSTMPLFHIGGTGWVLAGLYAGASVLVLRDVDVAVLLKTMHERAVTTVIAVPAVVKMMLDSAALAPAGYPALHTLYYGGGPITQQVLTDALTRFDCDFVQGFGMSECPLVTVLPPEDHLALTEVLRSCGRPIPGTQMRLVDPETRIDVSPGDVGELWVRSPSTMVGYWHQEELTATTLVDGEWLRTGDAGSADHDGRIYLRDRLKDMIVTGGENVYSAEVENVLMSHPAVAACAVIGVPSERWTETVKAIVVTAAGSTVTADELVAHCRMRLAGYKCPTSVDFIAMLPQTPSGKVMKNELRRHFAV